MDVGAVIEKVQGDIDTAVEAIEADAQASPVLLAVANEYGRKAAKAAATVEEANGDRLMIWEAIVELEQAGDSARTAALADSAISDATRDAVLAAHDTMCTYKEAVGRPHGRTWPAGVDREHGAGERGDTAIAIAESAAEFAVGAVIAPFTGGETMPIMATVDEMLDAGVDRLTHRGHRSAPEETAGTGN